MKIISVAELVVLLSIQNFFELKIGLVLMLCIAIAIRFQLHRSIFFLKRQCHSRPLLLDIEFYF